MTTHAIDTYAAALAAAARANGIVGGTPFYEVRNVGTLREQLAAAELYVSTKGPERKAVGERRAWAMARAVVATAITSGRRSA